MAGDDFATLQQWFAQEIAAQNIDWQREPMSIDGVSNFDYQANALIQQAERHWRLKYGFSPSPVTLQKAFYAALIKPAKPSRWRQFIQRIKRQ
ncbi:hypothetical protein [Salinibius halmophilus]|uniref:hypothetical protein n=1 Tax=Salinibius halmophilus TaxID=1853216 RepID=UPI000E663113|nr:hypothetical protein [Salinibius halmophilus]